MHFTYSELKEIYEGLIRLFSKKDSDIDSLEGAPSASDTVVIMHNNINKKTTVGNLIGHDDPLATVATTGSYNDLKNKPNLSTVATTGNYNDLTNKPTIPDVQIQADWEQIDSKSVDFIIHKPNLGIYEASYIPYTKDVTDEYIAEHSKLHWNDIFPSICHTVILQEPEDFSNYNLTPYIAYYIKTLVTSKDKKDSIIKLVFTAFWDDECSTNFKLNAIGGDPHLYGKFSTLYTDTYQIASPKGKKTKCCITILSNFEKGSEYFDITCECLGSEIS